MGEKHPNAKHDDETWNGFFERWHAGEASADLRREAGVCSDTWSRHAERLGMRLMDLPEDHPGRRGGAPDYHLRPEDWVDPRSGISEGRWRAANARRRAGDAMAEIAQDLGISENRAAIGLRRRFGLKRDDPEAVHRPRGRAALPGSPRDRTADPEAAFVLSPDDPEASLAAIKARMTEAAGVGALGRVTALCRTKRELEWALWEGASRLKAGMTNGPSHPSAAPLPSPEGEGDGLKLHGHQRAPVGDWSTWLVLGGRGAGKTLAGAVWAADQAARLGEGGRIALIGATLHDVRSVMIEGASGILSLPRWKETRPEWRPSLRTLRFPGGCEAQAFSAEDADSLRGPQFHAAWADEFCAWKGAGDALAMARLGLRLGDRPQAVVTTTPRPTRALKRLMGEASCVVSRAGTEANAAHLSPGFVEGLKALYGGTRLEAQEIEGQVVDDGLALFSAEMMAGCRGVSGGKWDRVVVGVDPSVTAGGNACGIVVVGRVGEACEVLADRTVGGVSPDAWARAVVAAAEDHSADEVVVEVNQGGELVTGLLKAVGAGLRVEGVRASVGKRARAEPVAALYEQGRVRHVGAGLERLEEELMAVGDEAGDLDRADALVWAVTRLMLGEARATPRARLPDITPRRWGIAGPPTACAGPVEGWLSEPEPWPRIR